MLDFKSRGPWFNSRLGVNCLFLHFLSFPLHNNVVSYSSDLFINISYYLSVKKLYYDLSKSLSPAQNHLINILSLTVHYPSLNRCETTQRERTQCKNMISANAPFTDTLKDDECQSVRPKIFRPRTRSPRMPFAQGPFTHQS